MATAVAPLGDLANVSEASSSVTRPKKQFNTGAIVSIKLRNFVTFEEVKFYCKPGLNLILGPNGSGKSTFVCALCLGLGGSTKLLGRAKEVKEFVKRGCTRGEIELELFREGKVTLIVKRCINSQDNTSLWYINGKHSIKDKIIETIGKMNIQLSNLCQFLPQDKVVEFAKMDKYKLLRATEQAIGSADLDEMHEELIELKLRDKGAKKRMETLTDKCKQLEQLNQLVQGDIERYMEKQKVMENVKELKQKKALIEYRIARNRWHEMKGKKKESIENLNEAKAHLEPAEDVISQIEKQILKLREESQGLSHKYRQGEKSLQQLTDSIRDAAGELEEPTREFQEKKKQEETRIAKIEFLTQEIDKFQKEVDNLPAPEDIAPKLAKVSKQTSSVDTKIRNIQDSKQDLEQDKMHFCRQLDEINRDIHMLNDIRTLRLKMIGRKEPDTMAAVDWLYKNTDMFQKQIFEPIITTVNAVNVKYTKMVEACIFSREKIAFVAQSPEDARHLTEELRVKKDLRIDCVYAPDHPSSHYKPPYPLEHIRNYGFETYLSLIIDAPDPVLAYMCDAFHVHTIPVHRNKEVSDFEMKQIQANLPLIRSFYSQDVHYSIQLSRYDSEKRMVTTQHIRKPMFMTTTGQLSKKTELQDKQGEITREISHIADQVQEFNEQEQQLRVEIESLRREKQQLADVSGGRKKLESNIKIKKARLIEASKSSFDLEEEERKCQEQISFIQENRIKMSSRLSDMILTLKENSKSHILVNLKKVQLAMKKTEHLKTIRKYQEEVDRLESMAKEFSQYESELKSTASDLLNDVETLLGHKISEIPSFMKQRLMDGTEEEDAIQKIQTQLHEFQAKLELCIATDPQTIKQYTERNKEIEGVHGDMEREARSNQNTQAEIDRLKKLWLVPLKELLEEVNTRFSYYFKQISCSGEVKLTIDDFAGEDEFDKYGVTINVKFRDEEELQQLTAFHQSGGERSVSTILYLMALQEHAQSPFRVVDEINQGMDSYYERCVFDFITSSASRPHTSQYFLLSPKLLSSLTFSSDMAIHSILNGPGVGKISFHY